MQEFEISRTGTHQDGRPWAEVTKDGGAGKLRAYFEPTNEVSVGDTIQLLDSALTWTYQ